MKVPVGAPCVVGNRDRIRVRGTSGRDLLCGRCVAQDPDLRRPCQSLDPRPTVSIGQVDLPVVSSLRYPCSEPGAHDRGSRGPTGSGPPVSPVSPLTVTTGRRPDPTTDSDLRGERPSPFGPGPSAPLSGLTPLFLLRPGLPVSNGQGPCAGGGSPPRKNLGQGEGRPGSSLLCSEGGESWESGSCERSLGTVAPSSPWDPLRGTWSLSRRSTLPSIPLCPSSGPPWCGTGGVGRWGRWKWHSVVVDHFRPDVPRHESVVSDTPFQGTGLAPYARFSTFNDPRKDSEAPVPVWVGLSFRPGSGTCRPGPTGGPSDSTRVDGPLDGAATGRRARSRLRPGGPRPPVVTPTPTRAAVSPC